MGVVRKGSCGLWADVDYMGTSGNMGGQLAPRSVLNDFTDDAVIISVVIFSKIRQSECWEHIDGGGYKKVLGYVILALIPWLFISPRP